MAGVTGVPSVQLRMEPEGFVSMGTSGSARDVDRDRLTSFYRNEPGVLTNPLVIYPGQYAPDALKTARLVRQRIMRSDMTDQFST